MKEIVTWEQADNILKATALLAPVTGFVIGGIIGIARKRIVPGLLLGVIIGLAGTVMFGLWRMYTAFGNSYGYTNVVILTVQLLLFAGIGFGTGFVIQKKYGSACNKKGIGTKAANEEEKLNAR